LADPKKLEQEAYSIEHDSPEGNTRTPEIQTALSPEGDKGEDFELDNVIACHCNERADDNTKGQTTITITTGNTRTVSLEFGTARRDGHGERDKLTA